MLRIRLRRVGKKGRPYYRIVVTEKRNPRDGAYIDGIGHYDPMADPPAVTLDEARAVDWLRKGAQPSDPVRRIFDRNDIFSKVHADERAD
ncbi:MAG: 30S ribosomal protein S16 [Dehalococcoidia bacterium]|nr:30S ribosomal protein S16 [Dehalococcoidia bacterium]